MLLSRAAISQDKAVGQLTDAILQRDQPRTANLFFQLVQRDGRSMGEAVSLVTEAEAPFVQVPNHINVRDGVITLINNDHTILGLRASASLTPYLPNEYRMLPMLQSVWYIPAGLDIWNQLLGKYPGRYATMKGIDVPPPDYGPVEVRRFLSWKESTYLRRITAQWCGIRTMNRSSNPARLAIVCIST